MFLASDICPLQRVTIVAIAIDALLGAGALARGWSSYLASLCNHGGSKGFQIQSGHYQLDFVAFGFMILLTIIVAAGTQQTSFINTGALPFLQSRHT